MAFVTTGFITFLTVYWSILPLVAVLDLIGIVIILFVDRLDPRSFVFWLMLIIVFPIGGLLLYFIFGNNFYSDRYFRRKLEVDRMYIDDPMDSTGEDKVSLMWTHEEFRDGMIRDLALVKESVWIEVPVIRNHTVWDGIMVEVSKLAAKGVDVRIMTASFGFGRSHGVLRAVRAGARFCTFSNRFYASLSKRYRNRNLRMQVILDGSIVYSGIGSIIRLEGPGASNYVRRFVLDWSHGSGDARRHVPVSVLGDGLRIVEDGRDVDDAGRSLEFLLDIAHSAKETLYMCMPYLTPDEDIHNTLKLSAYSGTDVRIILPARTWYAPQKWNSLAAAYPLLKAGVRVYFLDNHSNRRVLISDSRCCMVGSATMSRMTLDKDLNLSIIVDSPEVCRRAQEMFLRELEDAVECTAEEYENLSVRDRIRMMAARFCMYIN